MEWHPIQEEKKYSKLLHITGTRISSRLIGHLAHVQTLPFSLLTYGNVGYVIRRGVAWFLLMKCGLGTNLLKNFLLFFFESEGMMMNISSRFNVNASL